MEHDVASLRNDLRHIADHILAPVDTRIDSFLMDDGGTAHDTACIADTLQGHITALDNDGSHLTTVQGTTLIHITNHNLGGRDNDTLIVTIISTSIQTVKYICLDLLHLSFLLMHLLYALIYALLEFLQ